MNIFEFGRPKQKTMEPVESEPENVVHTPHSENLPDIFADVRNSLAAGKIGEADLELNLDYSKIEVLERAGKLTEEEAQLLRNEAVAFEAEIRREAA